MNSPFVLLILLFFIQSCSQLPEPGTRSDYHQIFSQSLQKDMDYSVYTPPNWTSDEVLPLVVLLHGGRDDHTTFDRYQVGEYLDQQISEGLVPRVMIVNPKGDLGFWENWYDGSKKYQDWVVNDVLNDVAIRYNHLSCPEFCHLMGISMGAHGALTIAADNPELFSTVTPISGRILTMPIDSNPTFSRRLLRFILPLNRIWGSQEQAIASGNTLYQRWLNDPLLADKSLFLTWGNEDHQDMMVFNELFHQDLVKSNRPHELQIYQGKHKWVDWKEVIAESLRRQVPN